MKNQILNPILYITTLALVFFSCSKNENTQNEEPEVVNEISIVEQYVEPDTYFQDAIVNFKKGDMEAVLNDLDRAKDFLRTVVYELDTVHVQDFLISSNEINVLEKRLRDGDSVTLKDFERTFTIVDLAIGSYHVAIIEEIVNVDENNPEATIRLKRALIRADNSLDYDQIDLPVNVMNELSQVSKEVLSTEKASKKLLEQTKEKIRIFNERMEENTNDLDGSLN